MKRIGFGFRFAVYAALLLAVAAFAQQPVNPTAGPVPPAILAAKTIFVSNAGADSGLFPSPFSGDPSRAYTQFFWDLKATGQFELASGPANADLVLELQLTASSPAFCYSDKGLPTIPGAAGPQPFLRLVIYDSKSHYILWTLNQAIGDAVGQKSHDLNFDAALQVLVEKFEQLAGKPVTPFR